MEKVILGLIDLFLLIRYAGVLRLTIPLLYVFLDPTIAVRVVVNVLQLHILPAHPAEFRR